MKRVNEWVWAITPTALATVNVTDEEAGNATIARGAAARNMSGAIVVFPVMGTITPRGNWITEMFGGFSLDRFRSELRKALADPSITGIILDIDSPGGQVSGVSEMANEIHAARGVKPITAVANHLAASAAYWLASAADEVWVAPTGEVGSIGVFALHQDISGYLERQGLAVNLIAAGKYKIEGNPYEKLTEEARATIQRRVSDYYEMFIGDVARFRGVKTSQVSGGFGEGRVVGAKTAVFEGMADTVGGLEAALQAMQSRIGRPTSRPRAVADVDYRRRRLRLV